MCGRSLGNGYAEFTFPLHTYRRNSLDVKAQQVVPIQGRHLLHPSDEDLSLGTPGFLLVASTGVISLRHTSSLVLL